jgi:hypothetical protein
MRPTIISIDHADGGIIVVFADGVTSLFEASFLYRQADKRIKQEKSRTGTRGSTRSKQAQKKTRPNKSKIG